MSLNGSNLSGMDLDTLFRLTERSWVAPYAEAQVVLYRHNVCLQDYFLPLQLGFGRPCASDILRRPFSRKALGLVSRHAYKTIRPPLRRTYKADVLYCPMPDFHRKKENRFLVRSLMGLAKTGASILCLLPENAPCRGEIATLLKAERRTNQVTLLAPEALLNPVRTRLLSLAARERCRSAFAEISQLLQPFGCSPPQDLQPSYLHFAWFAELWNSFEGFVEFDAVVSRCHWQALCSAVGRTAQQRGKPVITFQQGVIDHTLDVPVTASHYVAFGPSSAKFLAQMNRVFFKAVGTAEPPVNFVPGGALYDTLLDLPDQFEKRSLLLIDETDPNGFYGDDIENRGVLRLAREILELGVPLKRIIIRSHPYVNLDLEPWKQLVRDYPDSCELSHSAWTLEEDLKRVSAVVGNSSGVLTVASASGLPTFFLETDCLDTGDLACFRPGQTFQGADAFREIKRVLTDPNAHMEARAVALRNAREYFADGANLSLDGAFFDRMLRCKPDSALRQNISS